MTGINSCLLKYGEKEKLELLLIEISFLKFKIFSLPISAKSVYKIKCNLILEVKSKLTNSISNRHASIDKGWFCY